MRTNWFSELTGFDEGSVADVAAQFDLDGEWIVSRANGRRLRRGRFELVSLAELRRRWATADRSALGTGRLRAREVVGGVADLHADPAHTGATFQAASQFNALEMVHPEITPEAGITGYVHDATQGPACAVACAAGTIDRNWLLPVDGGVGQAADRQLNGIADLAAALGIEVPVRNGYAFPNRAALARAAEVIAAAGAEGRDDLLGRLRVGVQWDTEVTLDGAGHAVTQVYCSALPIAYSFEDIPLAEWEPLARLVLDAAYEATFLVVAINALATTNPTVFLTTVGTGAFGNPRPWALDAIGRSLRTFASVPLDVAVVSFGRSKPDIATLVASYDPGD